MGNFLSAQICVSTWFQANVNNILNRYYIDLPHPSHLVPGAGANALIGVNFRF